MKLFTFLSTVVIILATLSCSKDSDIDDSVTTTGIISNIYSSGTHIEDGGTWDEARSIIYDNNNKVIEINTISNGEPEVYHREFLIADDNLISNDSEGNTEKYILNSRGHITASTDGKKAIIYSGFYITEFKNGDKFSSHHTWNNENMVYSEYNYSGNIVDTYSYTYSDKENKMNLDPADIDETEEFGNYFITGYFGKRSRNLVEKIERDRSTIFFNYTFDQNGYVKTFTVKQVDSDGYSRTAEYIISYKN